ncbi:MAG: PorT family protein [Saprospiraceae bacterium]|nr:PorT family protein [Saprospiraceae bacterium]
MKKIVAIAAFLSLSLSMMAQDDLRFGFQLSPSFSWMNTNTSKINPSGTNLGLKLGMTGEYYFRENYAFTSGIGFYFNNGGTLLHDFGGSYWPNSDLPSSLDTLPNNVKLKYSIQYLEIPVGLKLRTREFGYLRYFMEPAITIGLKTQARGTIEGTGVQSDDKYNIRREVNLLNLAWGITGGVEYSISDNTSLIAGLGFQVGFTDVTDDKGQTFDPERGTVRERSKGTNNSITIRLGILF